MKKILFLILVTLSLIILTSCNSEDVVEQLDDLKKLSTPEVFISEDGLATWDEVKHAEEYAYRINDGKAIVTDETEVQLELGDYIRVKAIGDGKKYKDSSYSAKLIYEKNPSETESDFVINFDSNGGKGFMESQSVSLNSNDDIYLNENEFSREGYEFVGWTIYPDSDNVIFDDYISIHILKEYKSELGIEELTLYAVWEKNGSMPTKPLKIWVGSETVEFYEKVMREYARVNGIPENQIRVIGMDTGSAADTFLTDPDAGADIFTVPHDTLAKLLDGSGQIGALKSNALLSQMEANNPSSFLDVCYLQAGDGSAAEYYAAPISSQALVLYYNKSVFAGQEDKLASWEGIMEVARANNALATSFSGTDGYNYSTFLLAQPYNYSAKQVFGNKGTLRLYQNGVQDNCMGYGDDQVAIHKWAQRFITDPNGRNGQITSWDGWNYELASGNAITFVGGSWHLNNVADALGYSNYGIVELPTFTLTSTDAYGKAKAGMTFHSGCYVDAKCLVKKANSDWNEYLDDIIEYLTSDEIQQECYYQTASQPASINVDLGDNELARAQLAQAKYGIAQPFGFKAKYNTYYYSKGAPDLYIAIHENHNGEYGNNEKILNALQEISYIWAKGKYPSSKSELDSWVSSKGDYIDPVPTPDPIPTYSYHVVGGYYDDWSEYNNSNWMVEISLGELESDIAKNLLDKKIMGVYKLEGRTFGSKGNWTTNAYVDGQLITLDGGFTIKVVYAEYDPEDQVTFVKQWNPDPKTSTVQNLTPDTLFMPKWVETPEYGEEHLGTWSDNPVVIAGEGTYTVYFIEYAGINSYDSPKYAMAVVKTSDEIGEDDIIENAANGYYNYVNASYDEKAKINGILEKYAVKNNLTGLTLYEGCEYVMYHSSVIKGANDYIPGYGYGIISDGYINADLEGEENAVWKRYYHTFRTYDICSVNPQSLYYDYEYKDLLNYTSSTYFGMQMNEFKDGYNWVNLQSNSYSPEPVNATYYDNTLLASTYRIEVKVGQDYRYNTLSNNSQIAKFNGRQVQLEDYITPFKIIYTSSNQMSFAESYITNDITIKGLDKYYEASNNGFNAAAWENVGIKTYYQDGKAYIEFELNKEVNVFDAMYFLYENAYSPVPESFIQQLGNGNFDEGVKIWGNMSNDGLTPVDTWLSTGPYTIERWDMNQQIVLKKNPYYSLAGDWKYQIEGIHISILGAASNDYYAAIKEFNNGKLHEIKINSQIANEYKNDPRALIIPTGSTMKLNFNSCTQEEWESLFGVNGTVMQTELYNYWECKPIMSNDDFLKGISYSINRVEYADRFFGIPSNSYFGSNFVADPLSGIMYNDTDYHREAIKELSDGTEYGYNYQYAVSSFKKAAETLIADGYYTYGDVIEVEIAWQTPANEENHSYIKKYIEDAWNAADTGLQLDIVFWCGAVWSDVYYNKMMCGQYDIGFGSVSGNTINITGNFEMFKSDNSSGFTLNWGCDTNEVSADIYYDGMYWSFDALYEAATVGGYFENGKAVH